MKSVQFAFGLYGFNCILGTILTLICFPENDIFNVYDVYHGENLLLQ